MVTLVIGFMYWREYSKAADTLANIDEIISRVSATPSKMYSADNVLLWEGSEVRRVPFKSYADIPVNCRNAIIAAEDRRFFEHKGVDLQSMGRVLFTTVADRKISQGGSTLTMQLVKLLYTSSEKTFQRKLHDIALAEALETKLSKQEILKLYLNYVYFGKGAYGMEAAANTYYGKSAAKLTIAEAATLARVVRDPNRQNPFRDPKKALENRNVVLSLMRGENMISEEEYRHALAEAPKYAKARRANTVETREADFFVNEVLEAIEREAPEIDLKDGGYIIRTTLNTRVQKLAEAKVAEVVREHRRDKVNQAAFVLMNRDGQIKAMVGGPDYSKNQYNFVTMGRLQPGSSFKPFVYATAFAQGNITLNDSISNQFFKWPKDEYGDSWTPDNSGGSVGGFVSIHTAFKLSMNIPASRVMYAAKPDNVVTFCQSAFGFTSPLKPYKSLALGSELVSPLEMAQAYSVFLLQGDRVAPRYLVRITKDDDTYDRTFEPQITRNVLDKTVAQEVDSLMWEVVNNGGTGHAASDVPNARGKTGTTSDNKDAWFCGFSDGLIGIGWVGNESRVNGKVVHQRMGSSVFGGTVTVLFWRSIMAGAHDILKAQADPTLEANPYIPGRHHDVPPPASVQKPEDFPQPDDGTSTTTGAPGTTDTFPDKVPPINGDDHPAKPPVDPPKNDPPVTQPPVKPTTDDQDMVEVEICADTGMRATPYCPETVTRKFKKGTVPRKCTKHRG